MTGVTLFLIAALLTTGGDNGSSLTDDQKQTIGEQLIFHLDEYESTGSSNAGWLIYQLLESNPHSRPVFHDSAEDNMNRYDRVNAVAACMDPQLEVTNEAHAEDYMRLFVDCMGNPDLILAYLYDHDVDSQARSDLLSKLNRSELSDKQYYHYSYLSHENLQEAYPLSKGRVSPLDFYYFDHIFEQDTLSSDIGDQLTSWSDDQGNTINLEHSRDKVRLFVLINGFHKMQKEPAVFELAKSIGRYSQLPVSTTSLRILRYISFASYFLGYYQYDLDLNREMLLPLSEYFSMEEQLISRYEYGTSLLQLGNIHSAVEEFEYIYKHIEVFDDYRYQSATMNNLAITYNDIGRFENYLHLITSALDFAKETGDNYYKTLSLINLYIYHANLSNWEIATEYIEEIRSLASTIESDEILAKINRTLADHYRGYENDYEESLNHLLKFQAIGRSTGNKRTIMESYSKLFHLYLDFEHYDKAKETLKAFVREGKADNDEMILLYSYIKLAEVHFLQDNPDTAIQYVDSLQGYDESILSFRSRVERNEVIARKKIYTGEYEQAISILADAAEQIIERVRHSTDLQSGHMFFDSLYTSLLNLFIDQLLQYGRIAEALHWMDEVKNLSESTFFSNSALKATVLSESELLLDFALRNRIERLRSQLLEADDDRRIQIHNQLGEAVSEQNQLRRKVLQHVDLEPFDMDNLRGNLGNSDAIIYFSIFENNLYASSISSDSYDVQHIPFSKEEIDRADRLVESLSSDRIQMRELQWLREKVIDPIGIDENHTNLYVIPDGFLYHIPLEILPTNNVSGDFSYGETSYLIEQASISYANSLKDLESSFESPHGNTHRYDFLGFGISHFGNPESRLLPGKTLPPLPLAEREVSEIAENLKGLSNIVYHLSDSSTKHNFQNQAGESRILHLASHSEVYDKDPLYSLIYMNPGDNNDNPEQDNEIIYAYELFGMELSNEMIMLNSCESGSGNYIQGSGIVGFSRAFNYAGVESLVLNLWNIRDQSAYELSVSFYDHLNEGMGKNKAMQKAKIDYINNRNSNPSSWGSFVVYGNTDPVVSTFSAWTLVIPVLIIGFLSFLIAGLRTYNMNIRR